MVRAELKRSSKKKEVKVPRRIVRSGFRRYLQEGRTKSSLDLNVLLILLSFYTADYAANVFSLTSTRDTYTYTYIHSNKRLMVRLHNRVSRVRASGSKRMGRGNR
jgi:hypothetical protein